MRFKAASPHTNTGFTLIEVMLVLLIMGLAAGTVVYNLVANDPQEQLEKEARRFQVVFDMASDFAVLNQQQLGLRIEPDKGTYQFMLQDQETGKWQWLEANQAFALHQLPETFELELALDDLPWQQEDSLFESDGLFSEDSSFDEDVVNIGDDAEKKLPDPQVWIFNSGEFVPFSLIFSYHPEYGDSDDVYFRVNGIDFPPLELQGPLDTI